MPKHLILILAALWLCSCDLINPDEGSVSYIYVEDIPLSTDDGEGTPSEKIVDVWLNVNNELIGAYEMPIAIPVLNEGPVNLKVFPGIQVNGLSTDRTRYPFYQFYEEDVELIPGDILTITPQVEYIADVLVFTTEDFEDVGFKMERSVTSDTVMYAIENPDSEDALREGKFGVIYLDDERDHFKVNSTMELDLALQNIAYIEFDYKVDGAFTVGLRRTEPTLLDFSVAGFYPSLDENGDPQWNHVYVDLADAIDNLGNEDEYEIFFEGYNSSGDERTYCFDNIKVIHPLQ